MLNSTEGDTAPLVRLPVLLSVVEGMLEVRMSHLDQLETKGVEAVVKAEKAGCFVEDILEQQQFLSTVAVHCKIWREVSLRPGQLHQMEKLEARLEDLNAMHTELLNKLQPLTIFPSPSV